MDLFLVKKIISAAIMPLSIILILLLVAIVYVHQKPKLSFISLVSATTLLLLSTFAPFADFIMAPIENNYPAFTRSTTPLDYIIVLGCKHDSVSALPATSELGVCSLQRMVESIRILRLHPEATIITSGGAGNDPISNAEKVKQAAILLGVPAEKILTETSPMDTEQEARAIAPRVRGKQVALVTNADHLPRAMTYFAQQGVNAIAAPASPWVKHTEHKAWQYYVPKAIRLEQSSHVWYETLGRLVQWLKS